MAVLALRVLAR
jgi:hypothetical protein